MNALLTRRRPMALFYVNVYRLSISMVNSRGFEGTIMIVINVVNIAWVCFGNGLCIEY